VDVEPDLRTGRLVHVLPQWRSEPAPVCALFPSSRQASTRVRAFRDGMIKRLKPFEDRYKALLP
jgi:LysR family transcriptional activator of dmlA